MSGVSTGFEELTGTARPLVLEVGQTGPWVIKHNLLIQISRRKVEKYRPIIHSTSYYQETN